MIAGHYAVALALRSKKKSPRLGWLFAAVSFADILCYALILLGIEDFAFTPGFTAYFPFRLVNAWISHGLVGLAVISLGVFLLSRSWILAVAVFSHFPLDWLVHGHDMPIAWGSGPLVGAGLWNRPALSISLELAMLGAGLVLLLKRGDFHPDRRKKILFYLLLLWISLITIFLPAMPHPNSKPLVAISAGVTLLIVVFIAAWVDRTRNDLCICLHE